MSDEATPPAGDARPRIGGTRLHRVGTAAVVAAAAIGFVVEPGVGSMVVAGLGMMMVLALLGQIGPTAPAARSSDRARGAAALGMLILTVGIAAVVDGPAMIGALRIAAPALALAGVVLVAHGVLARHDSEARVASIGWAPMVVGLLLIAVASTVGISAILAALATGGVLAIGLIAAGPRLAIGIGAAIIVGLVALPPALERDPRGSIPQLHAAPIPAGEVAGPEAVDHPRLVLQTPIPVSLPAVPGLLGWLVLLLVWLGEVAALRMIAPTIPVAGLAVVGAVLLVAGVVEGMVLNPVAPLILAAALLVAPRAGGRLAGEGLARQNGRFDGAENAGDIGSGNP